MIVAHGTWLPSKQRFFLWGETEPQNIPGTTSEWPNWRRRARHALEELDSLPRLARLLGTIDTHRRSGRRE